MGGHVANAQAAHLRAGGGVFVVQQASDAPSEPTYGYVLRTGHGYKAKPIPELVQEEEWC